MHPMLDMIYWDHYYDKILLLNLLIVIGLFASLRVFSGTIAHINAAEELFKKDNPAFGISLAGATFAISIVLSGTLSGSPAETFLDAIIGVGLYGVIGIVLMALTRIIFDKITLPAVSIRHQIERGNIAVALADTANVIAAAIIIRGVMIWMPTNTLQSLLSLLGAYALSQLILTGITLFRIKTFDAKNKSGNTQSELEKGNVALALRFAGRKIGTAFAITVAAKIVVYEVYGLGQILTAWFAVSLLAIIVLKAICMLAEKLILFGVDLDREIIGQRNIAVGALQAAIYTALGLLLATL